MAFQGLKFSILYTLFFLLTGCRKAPDDQLGLISFKVACSDAWAETENLMKGLEGEVEKGGKRGPDVNVLQLTRRIASWKKPAVPQLSVAGLNKYIDSLAWWEKTMLDSYYFEYQHQDQLIFPGAISLPQPGIMKMNQLTSASDSLQFFQTLFLALKKEEKFLRYYSGKVGGNCWSFEKFRTDKRSYHAGDTVKMLIMVNRNFPERKLNFYTKGFKLFFENKPQKAPINTENINGIFYLKFAVPAKGSYSLKGAVYAYNPESKKSNLVMVIDNPVKAD